MPALAAAQLACNETKSCSTSTSLKVEHHLVDGAYVLCNFSSGLPLNYLYWDFSYSHLMGIFYRTIRMVDNGIKPVYVFDGKPPDMKGGELTKRAEKRQ